ncbi:hypothetical protein N5D61_05360 [Pseudomonas sp. GD03842]|uniref:hypothetical protein n=1 Tax=Pseudomonas sp. GD03842 TaxID=2975385 RepID=UPI0024488826|nr:hypothetical protein [Pseudomonas sp. GD03842]MDH0745767.1 hypothetical protein [Pseudomonas sp. GD03842]
MISLNIQIEAEPAQQAAVVGQASTTKPKLTTIKELAEVIKMDRSAARRYVLRLGIEPKRARTASSGFQTALVFTPEQVRQIVEARTNDGYC